jgi:hypothetical protein
MPTRNELERLAAAGRPLLVEAEPLVDADEEDRILERIVASSRAPGRARTPQPRRHALLLAGAALLAAAIAVVSTGLLGRSNPPAPRTHGPHRLALSGARIELSGYKFKTPAGFKASSDSCVAASSSSGPVTVLNGFAAAASADGGCVEAFLMVSSVGKSPGSEGAEPVAVGTYQGYFVPEDASGESTLYVQLPKLGDLSDYLALFAEGLTEQQLIAVAESGLPGKG